MTEPEVRVGPATLVLALGTLVSHGFGLSLVPALLPHIENEMESGYGALGLAVATGLLAYALGAAVTTRVMSIVPTRGLLLGTFVFSGLGFVVVALSGSPLLIAVPVALLGISAPISWAATIHLGRETVPSHRSGTVLAGASGGAAAGAIVNGVLVQTSASLHSWRISFVIAASIAMAVTVLAARVFPIPVEGPAGATASTRMVFARVLKDRTGLRIVITSAVAGVGVFTLATFLTATAIDEMGTSALSAASLLWVGGTVGLAAALFFGRLGDRQTPTRAIAIGMTTYSITLLLLAVGWSYPLLALAVVGYGTLNGPVWGLMGATANHRFPAEIAVGAVSLGLVAASLVGALGNSLSALWLESTGSMRGPVTMLTVLTLVTAVYLLGESRRERILESTPTDLPRY